MADAKKDAKDAKGKPKKRGGKLGFYTVAALLVFASPFIFPTIILITVGLLPTLVSLFTDTDRDKSSTAAVGAMNCAGIAPFMIDLWLKGHTVDHVFQILSDGLTWVVILGASAIGKFIVFAIPEAMAVMTFARYEARLKVLKKNLEELKTAWGSDVGTTKPLDQINHIN
jgi:uncharacterized membrane protein